MYSRKTLILYCAASISVTVAVGVIFVETVYPSIRGHLQTILLGRELETSGDFNDPALAQWARQKWDRLILESNERFDPKTLNRFIVDYAQLGVWENMFYLGVAIQKYPSDLMMMQQIILEVQPDVIIETGTRCRRVGAFLRSHSGRVGPEGFTGHHIGSLQAGERRLATTVVEAVR